MEHEPRRQWGFPLRGVGGHPPVGLTESLFLSVFSGVGGLRGLADRGVHVNDQPRPIAVYTSTRNSSLPWYDLLQGVPTEASLSEAAPGA